MKTSCRNENRQRSEAGTQPARIALFACLGLICHLLILLSLFLTYIEYFNAYAATDRGDPIVLIPNTGWQLLGEAFQPQLSQRVADMAAPPLSAPLAVVLLITFIIPALIYLAFLLPLSVKWKNIHLRRCIVLGSLLNIIGLSLSIFWLLTSPQYITGAEERVELAFATPPAAFLLSLICCRILFGYVRWSTEDDTGRV